MPRPSLCYALPAALLAVLSIAAGGCGDAAPTAPAGRPNVLFVVWDTVRADRLGLYGYARETTPFLDDWAKGARVFDDCLSAAPWTVPAHAALFTGLMPSETGASNAHRRLDDRFTTLGELLQGAGYRTYLFSANPFISREGNFAQGFETAQHVWDPPFREEVVAILREKTAGESGGDVLERVRAGEPQRWDAKTAGRVAAEALLDWLDAGDGTRPWFAFVNYMEAHRPIFPPRRLRERFLDDADLARSFALDKSWKTMWRYVFRLREMTPEEARVSSGIYDAAIAELDELLADLIGRLEARGLLRNTIVVLTADHGEHLGEHHLLDHQFSLYDDLMRVPLVIHFPGRVEPGREPRPVMNLDLFTTLLELTGVPPPAGVPVRGRSLLDPAAKRVRVAEYPDPSELVLGRFTASHPGFRPDRWRRSLRAVWSDGHKFIWASDGRHELFELGPDPAERADRLAAAPEQAREWLALLERERSGWLEPGPLESGEPLSPETVEQLRALGYLGDDP
jgi:arylsulfatase A-like enzyme